MDLACLLVSLVQYNDVLMDRWFQTGSFRGRARGQPILWCHIVIVMVPSGRDEMRCCWGTPSAMCGPPQAGRPSPRTHSLASARLPQPRYRPPWGPCADPRPGPPRGWGAAARPSGPSETKRRSWSVWTQNQTLPECRQTPGLLLTPREENV